MAATCMAVCKGSRKKIRGIFISSCHLPAAVECDIVILSEPGPNPTGPSWAVLQTQLIPARGRKLRRGCGRGGSDRTQLIPARGRKPFCISRAKPSPKTQLIPARGRKLVRKRPLTKVIDTTYPREGTETQRCRYNRRRREDTTYPREGTETPGPKISCETRDDTTYPREGTETSAFWGPPSWPWTQLIPARGRKQIISVLPDIK